METTDRLDKNISSVKLIKSFNILYRQQLILTLQLS